MTNWYYVEAKRNAGGNEVVEVECCRAEASPGMYWHPTIREAAAEELTLAPKRRGDLISGTRQVLEELARET